MSGVRMSGPESRGSVTVAHKPHKLEVAGAIPAAATRFSFLYWRAGIASLLR